MPDEDDYRREFPDASRLATRTARLLEVVGAQMEARIATTARGHGLSHAALNALAVIEGADEPITPGEIGAAMHITSGSITSVVDTLVRKGLAERSAHGDDRRKVLVEVTPAGGALLDELLPEVQVLVRVLLADLSERQQQTLADLLDKAAASMRAHEHDPLPAARRHRPPPRASA